MKYRRRIFFTDQQKAEIWDRWQRGESMSSIGRGFERNSSSIYPLLARTGDRSRAACPPDLLTRTEALMPITPRDIEDQFEDAALTLRRLPNPPGSGAKGYGKSWPEYIHDARQAYGTDEVRMRVVPSARDIQRMEDSIGWLAWLDPEDARIVWLRAEGVRWRQVCFRAGVVRSTAWRRWAASLLTIAKHLNALEKTERKASAPKRAADRNVVKPDESGSGTLL